MDFENVLDAIITMADVTVFYYETFTFGENESTQLTWTLDGRCPGVCGCLDKTLTALPHSKLQSPQIGGLRDRAGRDHHDRRRDRP